MDSISSGGMTKSSYLSIKREVEYRDGLSRIRLTSSMNNGFVQEEWRWFKKVEQSKRISGVRVLPGSSWGFG